MEILVRRWTMASYSQDLRQRVIDCVERNEGSLRQIARRFLVSLSFVVRLLQTYRRTGSLDPKPPAGGHPAALGPDDLERLKELVRQQPDATLEELRQRLGGSCSIMAIWRALEQLRLPGKKKVFRAQEQDSPEVQQKRQDFREELAGLDPRRLIFIDESGANTSMTWTYGRAPVGERVYGTVPGHWETITLTCGLRLSGVTEAIVFAGATNADTFEQYVEQVLVPELRPADVVIWDNLKAHQAEELVEAVEGAGARVVPLPPWSPDMTPIEEMFSKVKGALRSAGARTKEAVYTAFASALHDVTPEDIAGWFQSRAAYAMQP
jgi:transposase